MRLSAIISSPSRGASFYRAAYDAINFIAPERASRHANATSITGVIRRLLNRNISHHLSSYSKLGESECRGFSPITSATGIPRPLSLTHPFVHYVRSAVACVGKNFAY